MLDFIIVGRGLAAAVLMHTLHRNRLSFKVIGNENLSHCSRVSAGSWNPIVFKRLTKSWMAETLIPCLISFYGECEKTLCKKLMTHRLIIKPFTDENEKVLWTKQCIKPSFRDFLDPVMHDCVPSDFQQCDIPNGYGIVHNGGNLDVCEFLNATNSFFDEHIIEATFDHASLKVSPESIGYTHIVARYIIFCEGYLVKDNPLFNWVPFKFSKGEILTIHSKELKLKSKYILNREGYLLNIAPDIYKIGSTFTWDDLTPYATRQGLADLKAKLAMLTWSEYFVLRHDAGIRPTTADGRPILGTHPKYANVFIFNGLGTKGAMLAPYFANHFVVHLLKKTGIFPEVDVRRFHHLLR